MIVQMGVCQDCDFVHAPRGPVNDLEEKAIEHTQQSATDDEEHLVEIRTYAIPNSE